MTRPAYYNEIDPYAAQWLRNLIEAGAIAPGDVDERDIRDVFPSDLRGYGQCHFFAGLGAWSLALRLAGWPDERPAWTGSCPCQPFSSAGTRRGLADERHLWPAWHHLIRECSPGVVFGEQVASLDGLRWLDLIQADLEGEDYACAAVDLCAAGVGAPHIRQRLWFVAKSVGQRQQGERLQLQHQWTEASQARRSGKACQLGHAERDGLRIGRGAIASISDQPGHWSVCDWVQCRDGKLRPIEPGIFPLAHGVANRVGRLRAYGNAIVPQEAAHVIQAFMGIAA